MQLEQVWLHLIGSGIKICKPPDGPVNQQTEMTLTRSSDRRREVVEESKNRSSIHQQGGQARVLDPGNGIEEQVDKNLHSAGIGAKIRRLRLKRSMGLVELGAQTGLSASFLSQLETGRVIPTLRNLSRVALVFNKDLSYFFEPDGRAPFRVSRRNSRARLRIQNGRTGPMISESMSVLVPNRSLVPCIAEFPQSDADALFFPELFSGEEFVYVLDGSVTFTCGMEKVVLDPQDVFWTQGDAEREYRCKAGDTARVMIVTCPTTGRVHASARALGPA
jgi:transcriptional regulator with XRE-family HTH domain